MKIFARLEKSRPFWYLLGILLGFFLLRLPSLIEPNWYGDEGIYQVIGKSLRNGRLMYVGAWDNKPPLLFAIYWLFNGDQFWVRLFSLISGLFAIVAFFFLSKHLFKNLKTSYITTALFAFLFAIPLIEGNIANAENFMLFLNLVAGIFIYSFATKKRLHTEYKIFNTNYFLPLMSGLVIGVSFLFKIVAVFDFAAFTIFALIVTLPNRFSFSVSRLRSILKPTIINLLPMLVGFVLPITLTVLYYSFTPAFADFLRASLFGNAGYVAWKNQLIIPQGLLILKLILLALAIVFIYRKRNSFSKTELFIYVWIAFSLFNTYFSGRPYIHYVLLTLPAFCMLLGLYFETAGKRFRKFILLFVLVLGILLNHTFDFNFSKSFKYYGNALSFLAGRKSIEEYQTFFDSRTPRDYEIASFIKTHTTSKDTIFMWGDSAQIYALSNKLPPGRYSVAYHILDYENGVAETQKAISDAKPKYIITLKESSAFPFNVPGYDNKFVLEEGIIYERSL